MTASEITFNRAELALASYAILNNGATNPQSQRDALVAQGFTRKQADEFVLRYIEVVTQFNDTAAEGGLWAPAFRRPSSRIQRAT